MIDLSILLLITIEYYWKGLKFNIRWQESGGLQCVYIYMYHFELNLQLTYV